MASEFNWTFLTPIEGEKLAATINSEIQEKQEHVRCIVVPSSIGGPKLYFYNTFGMRCVSNEIMKLAMDTCEHYAEVRNAEEEKSGKLPKIFK